MPKKVRALTEEEVAALEKPGSYTVGGVQGLRLVIKGNSKSWAFKMTMPDGSHPDMGLGTYPKLSLAEAREKAQAIRERVKAGRDPLAERREEVQRQRAERAAEAVEGCPSAPVEYHMSRREIAAELGLSQDQTDRALYSAMRKVRAELARRELTLADLLDA